MDRIAEKILFSDLMNLIKILKLESHIHIIDEPIIEINIFGILIENDNKFYCLKTENSLKLIFGIDKAIEWLEIKYKKEIRQIKIKKLLAI